MNLIFKKIMVLSLFFLSFFVACDTSGELPSDLDNNQPQPDNTGISLGRLIGFWDFDHDGSNSVSNQAGDWNLANDITFSNDKALFPVKGEDLGFDKKNINEVSIDKISWDDSKGIHTYYYFSGAIRFKVSKNDSNHLLTFGQSQRFLHIKILNGKINVSVPADSLQIRSGISNKRIASPGFEFSSVSSIESDKWHILYFRFEEFSLPDRRIYIQLDNNAGEIFSYKMDYLKTIHNTTPGLDDIDRTMCFGNLGANERFEGDCDWVMLSNGRMTPENAQFHLMTLNSE